MEEYEVMNHRKKYTWKVFLMRVAAVVCMLTSVFGAYFSVFDIGIPMVVIWGMSFCTALMAVFVCLRGRYWWVRLIAVCGVAGLSIYYYRDRFWEGLVPYVNPYVERVNAFYRLYFPMMKAEADIQGTCLIMLCLMLGFALILCLVLEKKLGKIFAVLVLILPVILLAVIGEMPTLFWCWFMMIAMTIYLIVVNMSFYRIPVKEFIAASIVLVIMWMSSVFFTPIVHKYKDAHMDTYKEVKSAIIDSQQIDWKEITAGFVPDEENFGGNKQMDGQLKDLTGFYHTGRKIKEVVLDEQPTEAVYHREFIGAYYTGEAWLPPEIEDISPGILLYEQEQEIAEFLDLYVDGYEKKNLEELTAICEEWTTANFASSETIAAAIYRKCSAENGFRYEQYPGKMPEDRGFVEGFLFEKKEGFCVHYATAATIIYRLCKWPARYVEGYRIEPEDFELQTEGTYKAVVTDYMGHAWCETYEGSEGWKVREHTIASVEDNIPAATPTPANVEELSENDTQEQKQNVPDEMQEQAQDLENQHISDENTSDLSLFGGFDLFGGKKHSENQGFYGIADSIWHFMIGSVCIIGGAVLVVLLQQKLRNSRKMAGFRMIKGNKGILNIYNEVLELCEYVGKSKINAVLDYRMYSKGEQETKNQMGNKTEDETERKKIERLAERFTCLSKEEWMWMYECAERAAYGSELLSKEERREMYRLYQKLRNAIEAELSIQSKLWFLYGRAL